MNLTSTSSLLKGILVGLFLLSTTPTRAHDTHGGWVH